MSEANDDKLKRLVFTAVVAVWRIAFLVDVFDNTFEVPTVVHTLVAGIIGYFASSRLREKRNP